MIESTAEVETIVPSAEEAGGRIDSFLSKAFSEKSRTYFQYLIDEKHVLINGASVKKRAKVCEGDVITVQFILPPEIKLEPEDIPLDILYEDEHMVAINKPAGLISHPAPGNWNHTVVNAMLHHCANIENPEGTLRPGIVHRLDKDTTGVLVVAKTYDMQKKLSALFAERRVAKKYYALCIGKPASTHIEASIGRHPADRKKMAVVETGKDAVTDIEIEWFRNGISLLVARPYTGRTHQIRVHLAHVGTSIIGDKVYGSSTINTRYDAERQMLHAATLELDHPVTGEHMTFIAPMPDDMKTLISKQCK
jgi:23S rRNA pseudouridine1911/1915/1917 synthase